MTITRPRRTRKPSPNHELMSWLISVKARPTRDPPRRGFSTFINALAFSTLLSSQETDAHLWRNLRSPPGQPLNFTLESPSCQLRLPEATRKLKPHAGSSRHQGLTLPSAWSPCGHTRDLGRKFLAAPRVPVRLPAFR